MPNTREKLIELLKDTRANAAWHNWGYEESADHLIANGVTFAKDTNVLTNADRVRARTDEELAEFIRDVSYDCQSAYCGSHCQICSYPWCSSERTMEWLKQPAEEAAP